MRNLCKFGFLSFGSGSFTFSHGTKVEGDVEYDLTDEGLTIVWVNPPEVTPVPSDETFPWSFRDSGNVSYAQQGTRGSADNGVVFIGAKPGFMPVLTAEDVIRGLNR